MTSQEVIKKAIEGGWGDRLYRVETGNTSVWTHSTAMFLDPLFWQALGKSLGWESWKDRYEAKEAMFEAVPKYVDEWEYRWHQFIHHLASGKTIESYFEKL